MTPPYNTQRDERQQTRRRTAPVSENLAPFQRKRALFELSSKPLYIFSPKAVYTQHINLDAVPIYRLYSIYIYTGAIRRSLIQIGDKSRFEVGKKNRTKPRPREEVLRRRRHPSVYSILSGAARASCTDAVARRIVTLFFFFVGRIVCFEAR